MKKGFTLLEVLLAMMLMATAMVLLANSWSAAFGRVKKTQVSFEMAALLENKMNEYERKYRGKALAEISDEEADNFGDDYPQYSWKMKAKKFTSVDISALLTGKANGADEMTLQLAKKLTDHLAETIKELQVTVTYKHPKRPIDVSATMYFVDYDKPLSLGLPGAAPPPPAGSQ